MPVYAIYDIVNDPPRAVQWPFELCARRIAETWLATREVAATLDDLRLATPFLRGCGITVESLPGREVRVSSDRGQTTVMSREAVIMTALRCLATLDAQRSTRGAARAA